MIKRSVHWSYLTLQNQRQLLKNRSVQCAQTNKQIPCEKRDFHVLRVCEKVTFASIVQLKKKLKYCVVYEPQSPRPLRLLYFQ